MSKVLIAYVSKKGSTKEVAEEIGKVLGQCGLVTDILPISDIKSLKGYTGVVVGAPINGMNWLPEATNFVEQNQEELKKIPTAYFFLSYLLVQGGSFWKKIAKKSLNKISETAPPVMVGMFGGKVDSGFPKIAKLIFGIKKNAPLDVRNWDSIRIWSHELSEDFK